MAITLHKLKYQIKAHGFWVFLKKGLRRVHRFVFSYHPLIFYEISRAPQTDMKARCPLDIRKGCCEDTDLILGLLSYMDEPSARQRIEKAFNQGAQVFLAFSKGDLVHVIWLYYHPGVREQLVNVKLKPDEAHIAAAYTSSEFRGQGIYPMILQYMVRYAISEGKKRIYIAAAPKNIASCKGIEKAGFSKVATIRGIMILGKLFNCNWES